MLGLEKVSIWKPKVRASQVLGSCFPPAGRILSGVGWSQWRTDVHEFCSSDLYPFHNLLLALKYFSRSRMVGYQICHSLHPSVLITLLPNLGRRSSFRLVDFGPPFVIKVASSYRTPPLSEERIPSYPKFLTACPWCFYLDHGGLSICSFQCAFLTWLPSTTH